MGNLIVTIGRENGSGGHEIGQLLAEKLGVKCYDKEILSEAAKNSGYAEQIFNEYDESSQKNMLFSWAAGAGTFSLGLPLSTQLYLEQVKTIRALAAKGSCVFVGRCSDYILREQGFNLVNIFIHAPLKVRIERISMRHDVDLDKARLMVMKNDKNRASYYNYYTDQKWGAVANYQLSIDTDPIGVNGAVELISEYLRISGKR